MHMTPRLLVGIDTEGDNQWSAEAREHQTFENICALPALHSLFERHGVRPTYVVTWPVASDERSQEVLRFLLLRGDCEIGAHHHAWETPPCTPEDVRRHRYAATLPVAQFDAQLAELTAAITRAVGERPVSYRSGRFGFDAAHVSALERFGYTNYYIDAANQRLVPVTTDDLQPGCVEDYLAIKSGTEPLAEVNGWKVSAPLTREEWLAWMRNVCRPDTTPPVAAHVVRQYAIAPDWIQADPLVREFVSARQAAAS